LAKKPQSDDEINDLKIGAIFEAVFRTRKRSRSTSGYVAQRSEPCSASSGDFYWGRQVGSAATIVVGDTIGHNAYSALLGIVVGLNLDTIGRLGEKTGGGRKRLASPRHILIDLAKRFAEIQSDASDILDTRDYREIGDKLKRDGFDAVACVVKPNQLLIATAGLPAFILSEKGRVTLVGTFSTSNITGNKSSRANIARSKAVTGDNRFAIFVSDGIVEQRNARQTQFGIGRLKRALASLYKKDTEGCTAESLADGIFAASDKHKAGIKARDDRLAVVVDIRVCRKKLLASK
jgi:hypothetical protein